MELSLWAFCTSPSTVGSVTRNRFLAFNHFCLPAFSKWPANVTPLTAAKGAKVRGGGGGQSPEVYAQFLLISLIFNISSNFVQNVVHSKDPGGWSFCSLWARCWTKINAKYTSGLLEATSAFPTSRANKHAPPDRHTVLQASYGKS